MKRRLFKILKRTLIIIFILIAAIVVTAFFYMRLAKFGEAPSGERLIAMGKSGHFKNGKFQNIHETPELTEGNSAWSVTWDFMFNRAKRRRPVDIIPSIKTDLKKLPPDSNVLIWFGHSSYFMQIDGRTFLADPVFSGNASPIPGTNESFEGTDVYTVADLPPIDYVIISHDHYDHTDFETLTALQSKTGKVICGLGVGAHFEHWGFPKEQIIEKDWNETIDIGDGFVIYTTPARHFSGRGLTRNNTLWMSYVLKTPSMKVYIGGDSGYDTHYSEIGNQFGPIDVVILDNGQYDLKWRYIHTLPEEVIQAAADLKAKRLFPVHSSKFMMANHPWDEPLIRVTALNAGSPHPLPLITPIIGEPVNLRDTAQSFKQWWIGLQ